MAGEERREETNTSNDIFMLQESLEVLETPGRDATRRMIYKHNKAERYVAASPQIVMSHAVAVVGCACVGLDCAVDSLDFSLVFCALSKCLAVVFNFSFSFVRVGRRAEQEEAQRERHI